KASDYDIVTHSVLQVAIEIYCAILLNDDLFPSGSKELEWVKGVWMFACSHHAVQLEHDGTLLKLVSAYCLNTHLQGQFKVRACPIVATMFRFETSADKDMQEKNCALITYALFSKIHGATLDKHTGHYTNPAIQKLINEMLFKNKSDNALCWEKYYSPFPHAVFALTLIDEWASGACEMSPFKEENYSSVFSDHLASLDEFDKMTTKYKLLPNLLKQVYVNG
ncbi:hypothetical protein EV363DRAFT_1083436, partial [Boletus edulis]